MWMDFWEKVGSGWVGNICSVGPWNPSLENPCGSQTISASWPFKRSNWHSKSAETSFFVKEISGVKCSKDTNKSFAIELLDKYMGQNSTEYGASVSKTQSTFFVFKKHTWNWPFSKRDNWKGGSSPLTSHSEHSGPPFSTQSQSRNKNCWYSYKSRVCWSGPPSLGWNVTHFWENLGIWYLCGGSTRKVRGGSWLSLLAASWWQSSLQCRTFSVACYPGLTHMSNFFIPGFPKITVGELPFNITKDNNSHLLSIVTHNLRSPL